jgi:hypothetical protein
MRQVATACTAPLAVVKNLDLFLDRRLGMGTRFIMLVVSQFIFQAAHKLSIGALSSNFLCAT